METRIELIQGDITGIEADAIVNAANKTLLGGGGVDGAIHRAAGIELLAACKKLGGCETGQAKITKGYSLKAKYVIHTVGPVWQGGNSNEKELLGACYRNTLAVARAYKLKSIAFPSISTGAYRFPIALAAPIALCTTKEFLKERNFGFEKIIFVLFSENDLLMYQEIYKQTF